jgi:16S rRNA (uracil1498-N3)-methyltransferase
LPRILLPCSVAEACAASTAGLRLTLAIDGAEPLPTLLRNAGPALGAGVAVLIGPEGGLDDSEQAVAAQHGFRSTLLGPRVLRTETASLAVLSALQALAGDFDRAPSLP